MDRQEAAGQVNAFAKRIGVAGAANDFTKPLQVRLGESVVGFEFDDAAGAIVTRALIYRFRKSPAEKTLAAILAAETTSNTGGGTLVFDEVSTTLFLERSFSDRVDDDSFYAEINRLAQASMIWTTRTLGDAAEKSAGS